MSAVDRISYQSHRTSFAMDGYYAIIFCPLLFFLAWYFLRNRGVKQNFPPMPPGLPIIGNLHQVGDLPHRSLRALSDQYGAMMLLRFGSKPVLIISSAEAAKEILRTHDISFANRPELSSLKKMFYDMKDVMNLPYGDQWRKLRSIFVLRLLSSTRVKSFNTLREEEISCLVEKIKQSCSSSSPVNLSDMFFALTYDMISRAAFGKKRSEMNPKQAEDMVNVMKEVVGLLFKFKVGEFIPWLSWVDWFSGFNDTVDKCAKKVDEMLVAFVEEHLNKAPEENQDNFLDILLGIYKGNSPGVSIDMMTVKSMIEDVFGAGTETSATTLEWAMTGILKHPEVMERLQEEARQIMNGREKITNEDVEKMQYLKAVVKETLRYYPTTPLYVHSNVEAVKVNGYDIPAKTMVLVNAFAVSRDPKYWQDPDKFIPERFLNSSVDFRGFDFQFVPFGSGRRICPGMEFAAAAIEHTLANLMYKFDWGLPGGARGEDLNETERAGFTCARKNPLFVVPIKCYC